MLFYLVIIYMSSTTNNENIDYSTTAQFKEMQLRNEQTLSDIQGLQEIEKGLFTTLESGMANNKVEPEEQEKIINKINELSNMRINLYKNLNGMYGFLKQNIYSTRDTISEQTAAIDIVENELNEAKRRLKVVQQDNNNKVRLVEINTYYGDKYNDYAGTMKAVVILCIPVLILTLLLNNKILSSKIYVILLVIIGIFGFFYIGQRLLYSFSKDNMNYDQYNWHTNRSSLPAINTENPDGLENPWESTASMCTGGSCCPVGYSYSDVENKCVSSELLNEQTTINETSLNKFLNETSGSGNRNNGVSQMGGFGSL